MGHLLQIKQKKISQRKKTKSFSSRERRIKLSGWPLFHFMSYAIASPSDQGAASAQAHTDHAVKIVAFLRIPLSADTFQLDYVRLEEHDRIIVSTIIRTGIYRLECSRSCYLRELKESLISFLFIRGIRLISFLKWPFFFLFLSILNGQHGTYLNYIIPSHLDPQTTWILQFLTKERQW